MKRIIFPVLVFVISIALISCTSTGADSEFEKISIVDSRNSVTALGEAYGDPAFSIPEFLQKSPMSHPDHAFKSNGSIAFKAGVSEKGIDVAFTVSIYKWLGDNIENNEPVALSKIYRMTSPFEKKFFWKPVFSNGEKVPPGHYIIFLDYYKNGELYTERILIYYIF